MLECMQSKDFEEILSHTNAADEYKRDVIPAVPPNTGFGPSDDGAFMGEGAFMPGNTGELVSEGRFNKDVEIFIGTTSEDGIVGIMPALKVPLLYSVMRSRWEHFGAMLLTGTDPYQSEDRQEEDSDLANRMADIYLDGIDNLDRVSIIN